MSAHKIRFPGETPAYRAARDKLLDAEIELRRATEKVAAQRRELPLGGEVPEDYVFEEIVGDYGKGKKRQVRMSDLFEDGKDTLILYNFMYGPKMKNTELMFAPADPGQDMRHVDTIWPVWNLFDVTPDGRGEKWNPKLSY